MSEQLVGRAVRDALVAHVADVITVLSADGMVLYQSPSLQRTLGHSPAERIGRNIFDDPIVHPDDLEVKRQFLRDAVSSPGQEVPAQFRMRHADGTWRYIEAVGINRLAEPGVEGVVATYRDVTERRHRDAVQDFLVRAGAVLSESLDYEETLDRVVHLAVPLLADWCSVHLPDAHGVLRLVTVAHPDPAREALAWRLERQYPPDPDGRHGPGAVMLTGEPQLISLITEEMLSAPGVNPETAALARELHLHSSLVVPLTARGERLGTLTMVTAESGRSLQDTDVGLATILAGRCGLALANSRLYREARDAVQQREEFVSIAAHELRSPLTALRGYTQLLRRDVARQELDRERIVARADRIEAQVPRLMHFVDELLDVSRLQAGRLELNYTTFDLAALVHEVVERAEQVGDARSEHHLVVDAPEPVSGSWDRGRIDQVLTNLVSNALKYSPAGGEVRVSAGRTDPDHVVLSVSDQGIGLSPSQQQRLFQPFARPVRMPDIDGTGLGLYIAQGLVAAHNGRIVVKSAPGSGSTFTVHLPG